MKIEPRHNGVSWRKYVAVYIFAGLTLMMAGSLFAASSIYDFTMKSIDGTPTPLASFKGNVVLVVNVASQCGFTPQYKGLESVYEKYKGKGFVILGFPSNDFEQEPGTNAEIKTFCSAKYNVTFPMFSKIPVGGKAQNPLYAYLTKEANPSLKGAIQWNFTKFLVDRSGHVVARFESPVEPDSPEVISSIEKALGR
jgi:glutathione peroxidase